MVACPTHTQTLLSRLPESEWPSTLPDGTSLPRTATTCLLNDELAPSERNAWVSYGHHGGACGASKLLHPLMSLLKHGPRLLQAARRHAAG